MLAVLILISSTSHGEIYPNGENVGSVAFTLSNDTVG